MLMTRADRNPIEVAPVGRSFLVQSETARGTRVDRNNVSTSGWTPTWQ